VRRRLAFSAEIIFISALILVTRCANYGDVFFSGQINFIDADCYARMTRARICFERPGTIVRRHDFENFPIGTSPHTTAPLDYLIVAIAAVLKPLTNNALDLAGALVSPLVSMALGIFLGWWTRRARLRFRWAVLILYALSPILAHAFALGRPDHQALVITLITVALCAEWSLGYRLAGRARALRAGVAAPASQSSAALQSRGESSKWWSIVSGASWAMALWVSLYEPIVLLLIVLAVRRRALFIRERRIGWIVFAAILALALMIEQRIPQWPNREFALTLKNWSGSVGELSHVSLGDPIWFSWCGWLVLLGPMLFWPKRDRTMPWFLKALFITTFGLTLWQARWAYFFVMIFALALPELLSVVRKPVFAAALFIVGLFPIAQSWDRMFTDEESARRTENNLEMLEIHAIASRCDGPFIAPWWFSPALSYWSRQPGVGGSSHESIAGVVESAKVFGTQTAEEVAQVLKRDDVNLVIAYDGDRLARNSELILGYPISPNAFCYLLDRRPSQLPPFLRLIAQTGRFKLFRVVNP
jgi:MFS family permease